MDYTLAIIILGTGVLGLVSGTLGCFAVLRRQSLLGDAIAHAALPGLCLAFLITETKSPWVLFCGALAAGWVGTLLLNIVAKYTTLKKDAILGIILSVFFGLGLVLLTYIQKQAHLDKTGLSTYLFGSAATLLERDVVMMASVSFIVLVLVALLWKEFKLISFDPDFAFSMGFPRYKLDFFLTMLIVSAIVVGLQTVGVVLMSALVIAPAVAARQWTDSLAIMIMIAALFGVISGVSGALLSAMVMKLPTGPTIVIVVSVLVFLSLFFAPHRGLYWEKRRLKKQKRRLLSHEY